jgi:hypothetical protein
VLLLVILNDEAELWVECVDREWRSVPRRPRIAQQKREAMLAESFHAENGVAQLDHPASSLAPLPEDAVLSRAGLANRSLVLPEVIVARIRSMSRCSGLPALTNH